MIDVFGYRDNPHYPILQSWGPSWWKEFTEMDANYQYAGWLLDLMGYWLDKVVSNQFPLHADEKRIAEFEALLKIDPDEGESLDERRRIVSVYYSGASKLSGSSIQSMIRTYAGSESELWWETDDHGNKILMTRVLCDDDVSFSNKQIYKFINRKMPAHLDYEIRYMVSEFFLEESWSDRIRHRIQFVWWPSTLDGEYLLNGAVNLNSRELPPYFSQRIPWEVSEWDSERILDGGSNLNGAYLMDGATLVGFVKMFFEVQESLRDEFIPKQRIPFNWWDYDMLDGEYELNGAIVMDHIAGPVIGLPIIETEAKQANDVGFYVYSAGSGFLNGHHTMNGSVTQMNTGREEL